MVGPVNDLVPSIHVITPCNGSSPNGFVSPVQAHAAYAPLSSIDGLVHNHHLQLPAEPLLTAVTDTPCVQAGLAPGLVLPDPLLAASVLRAVTDDAEALACWLAAERAAAATRLRGVMDDPQAWAVRAAVWGDVGWSGAALALTPWDCGHALLLGPFVPLMCSRVPKWVAMGSRDQLF